MRGAPLRAGESRSGYERNWATYLGPDVYKRGRRFPSSSAKIDISPRSPSSVRTRAANLTTLITLNCCCFCPSPCLTNSPPTQCASLSPSSTRAATRPQSKKFPTPRAGRGIVPERTPSRSTAPDPAKTVSPSKPETWADSGATCRCLVRPLSSDAA
ncbi:hypothetical protein N656DRAFT_283162 [Canariomyces notabilis]|uniref:Uncharacterized protein n=1 Tax=Canariomyces notabilis TaxID=2074819 RepID=A0AAN6YXZ8_9PEZI|nr:hypothetical protein N656DRAFT_283162 [Canariomyces arenarius]